MSDTVFDTAEAAESAFYEAFTTLDLDLMGSVWSDDCTSLCIHPGGELLRGKRAVMQSWMEIFANGTPAIIEYSYLDGYGSSDLKVRLVEERIRPRSKPPEAANRVLATNVFLRQGGSWRLAEHHASLPLVKPTRSDNDRHRLH